MAQPSDIPLDTASIISTVLEGILYGFSLLMFIGTLWALFQRNIKRAANRRMVAVAHSLLLFSTAHMIIDIIRIEEGLVQQRSTFLGGPIAFFSDVAQWSFVYKNVLYMLQTLVGDGVVIYRCYVVWQSWYIITIPCILWCSVAATGAGCIYSISQATVNKEDIFAPGTGPWITSFLAATLFTNLLSTSLLAYRIWSIGRRVSNVALATSLIWPILRVILDAGVLYSLSLLAALICFIAKNHGHYVLLDMIMPIISITFYMVIIRITITKSSSQSNEEPSIALSNYLTRRSRGRSSYVDPQRYPTKRMEVHITQLTEHEFDPSKPRSSSDDNPPGMSLPSSVAKFDSAAVQHAFLDN
ncbi:hypothetical protein DEU56DRAFT_833371 [Suillus clintonianus]|uniref:uncharacterized protein n=1 Tax=Suillus clintonianus TaxID=1904413 RepID=UPI001B868C12|nr:uncharacterized protein DEU56DRAFT_833371 [Suillus clintonianus]KAG2121858.1 hypothetical protein DEU56DRAFT_833371 [Suillus clintonianus]